MAEAHELEHALELQSMPSDHDGPGPERRDTKLGEGDSGSDEDKAVEGDEGEAGSGREGFVGSREVARALRESDSVASLRSQSQSPATSPRSAAIVRRLSNKKSRGGATRDKVALLLINVQNDFMENGAIGVPGANREYVEKLNALRSLVAWDCVVVVRERHPSNHCSFVSNTPNAQHGQSIRFGDVEVTTWYDNCVQGDFGEEPPEGFITEPTDVLVETGMNPTDYSPGCFKDKDSRLSQFLRHNAITSVFMAGLPLDVHVRHAAVQAPDDNIQPYVIADACLALDPGHPTVPESMLVQTSDVKALVASLTALNPPAVVSYPPPAFKTIMRFVRGDDSQRLQALKIITTKPTPFYLLRPSPITGRTLLHDVCSSPHPNALVIAEKLVAIPELDINAPSLVQERTAIVFACMNRCVEMVKFLCSQPNIEILRPDYNNAPPIIYAIQSHELEIVQTLINKEGSWQLGERDRFDRTPLMVACESAGVLENWDFARHNDREEAEEDDEEEEEEDDDNNNNKGGRKSNRASNEPREKSRKRDADVVRRAGQRAVHRKGGSSRGRRVLRWLWPQFPAANFTDTNTDQGGWQFWHYAVKHDLKARLRNKLRGIAPTVARTIIPPHLVTLTVWLASESIKLTSYGILKEILGLFYPPPHVARFSSSLDMVIDDVDPEVAFIMCEHGLLPLKKKSERVLLYKALIHGRANVVRCMMASEGVRDQDERNGRARAGVDEHIVRFAKGMRYFHCCTQHFITQHVSILQPCYTVHLESRSFVVCCQCALVCWVNAVSVEFAGYWASACQCRQEMVADGAQCLCIDHRVHSTDEADAFPESNFPIYVPNKKVRQQVDEANVMVPKGLSFEEYLAQLHDDTMIPIHHTMSFRDYITLVFVMSASAQGNHRVLRALLNDEVKEGTVMEFALDSAHDTCLHMAARNNHVKVIEILRNPPKAPSNRIDLAQHNNDGHMPLTIAALQGHSQACRAVFSGDAMCKLDRDGLTPLHHAIKNGHVHIVRLLGKLFQGESAKFDVSLDKLFFQPLTMGNHIERGAKAPMNVSLVDFRVKKVKAGYSESHACPLHLAVRYGRPQCVETLIELGSNPFFKDGTGYSAYHTAIWEHYKARSMFGAEAFVGPHHTERELTQPAGVDLPGAEGRKQSEPNHLRAYSLQDKSKSSNLADSEGGGGGVVPGSKGSVASLEHHSSFAVSRPLGKLGESMGRAARMSVTHISGMGGSGAEDRSSKRLDATPGLGDIAANAGRRSSFGPMGNVLKSRGSWLEYMRRQVNKRKDHEVQPPAIARAILEGMQTDERVRLRAVRFAYTRFYLMSVWYLLMTLAYLLCTLPRTSHRFDTTNWMETRVVNTTHVNELHNSTQLYQYLREHYVSEEVLLQAPTDRTNNPVGVVMLGSVRVYQVRSKLRNIESEIEANVFARVTYAKFHTSEEEREGGWSAEDTTALGTAAQYSTDLGVSDYAAGEFGTYPPRGYAVVLHKHDAALNNETLNTLEANHWIDEHTRAVFVDFSVYNFNLPIFASARLLFEFAPTGDMPSSVQVLAHKIFDNTPVSISNFYFPSTAFTVVVALMWLFLVLSELSDMVEQRREYLKNIGNVYDVANVICVSVLLVASVDALDSVESMLPMTNEQFADPYNFVPLLSVLSKAELMTKLLGIIALLIWVRVLQYTVFLPTVGPVVRALVNTLKDVSVMAFTVGLLFFLWGFTFSMRTIVSFEEQTKEYRTTFALLFSLTLGEYPDTEFSRPVVLLVMIFVMVMAVVFVNIFISVLSDVYPDKTREANERYDESIIELIENDLVRRGTPFFVSRSSLRWVRLLHLVFVRPFLDAITRLLGFAFGLWFLVCKKHVPNWVQRVHPDLSRGDREFGWDKGLTELAKEERKLRWSMRNGQGFSEFDGVRTSFLER